MKKKILILLPTLNEVHHIVNLYNKISNLNIKANILKSKDLDSIKIPTPTAVKITVPIHHNCLEPNSDLFIPGSSGGNPKDGAKEKTINPIEPQNNPDLILTDLPRSI